MEKLTDDIDKILHGRKDIRINDNLEGELSVLQNELSKMLIILNEQNDKLKNEKKFLSDSIADISHQLRTPLTSINLILSLLHEPDISDEKRLELLHKLSQLIARTDYLINVLLKMSKIDAGTVTFEKKQVKVEKLIAKAVEPLEVALELKVRPLSPIYGTKVLSGICPGQRKQSGTSSRTAMSIHRGAVQSPSKPKVHRSIPKSRFPTAEAELTGKISRIFLSGFIKAKIPRTTASASVLLLHRRLLPVRTERSKPQTAETAAQNLL